MSEIVLWQGRVQRGIIKQKHWYRIVFLKRDGGEIQLQRDKIGRWYPDDSCFLEDILREKFDINT